MASVELQLKQRTDTAANWTSNDPVLALGELGFETDTGRFKVGLGTAVWSLLSYSDAAQFLCPTFQECLYIQQDDDTNLDQTLWKMDALGDQFAFQLIDDADVNSTDVWQVERSGIGASMVTDSMTVTATTFAVVGLITVTGTVDGRDIDADGTAQDTHIADGTIHFTEASIDHTAITNVGTNTHAQIDTHIAAASDDSAANFSNTFMLMGA